MPETQWTPQGEDTQAGTAARLVYATRALAAMSKAMLQYRFRYTEGTVGLGDVARMNAELSPLLALSPDERVTVENAATVQLCETDFPTTYRQQPPFQIKRP